jgi:Protein of unknown function (DUF1275)
MTVDRRHGPLPVLLVGLTVVTGLVEAFSILRLGHVFVANMTGNVVFLGLALAGVGEVSILRRAFWRWWPSPSAQQWAGGGPQGEWCTAGTFWQQPPHQFRRASSWSRPSSQTAPVHKLRRCG